MLPEAALAAIAVYEALKVDIAACSDSLLACNAEIALVKERVATALAADGR